MSDVDTGAMFAKVRWPEANGAPVSPQGGGHLLRHAQESSWRENHRHMSNGGQVTRVAGLAMRKVASSDFTGYWQRHTAN